MQKKFKGEVFKQTVSWAVFWAELSRQILKYAHKHCLDLFDPWKGRDGWIMSRQILFSLLTSFDLPLLLSLSLSKALRIPKYVEIAAAEVVWANRVPWELRPHVWNHNVTKLPFLTRRGELRHKLHALYIAHLPAIDVSILYCRLKKHLLSPSDHVTRVEMTAAVVFERRNTMLKNKMVV